MFETYRLLGKQHEDELLREAQRLQAGAVASSRRRRRSFPPLEAVGEIRALGRRKRKRLGSQATMPVDFLCLLLVAAAAFTAAAGPAAARPFVGEEPRLEPVASAIAHRPVTVLCYRHGEPGDPLLLGAWSYVGLFGSAVNLSKEACEGALAIVDRDTSTPLIEQALGALSLTHESFHLKIDLPLARRMSEAQTECRAVKRVQQTILELSGSSALADQLLPWALAVHFKTVATSKAYDLPGCRVPVFDDFWR